MLATDTLSDFDRNFVESARKFLFSDKDSPCPGCVSLPNGDAIFLIGIIDKLAPKPEPLKRCPFCGMTPMVTDSGIVHCETSACILCESSYHIDKWQKRAGA